MELNTLNPGKAAKGKSRRRIGRGPGSGFGTTAGRGQKGAGARKSAKAGRVAFEGGQIHRDDGIPLGRVRIAQQVVGISILPAHARHVSGQVNTLVFQMKVLSAAAQQHNRSDHCRQAQYSNQPSQSFFSHGMPLLLV